MHLTYFIADAEIQLPGGHKIKAFEGNTTQVLVSFTKADAELLTAVISSDISITINGTINTLHNNGSVNITPSDINTLDYGTYRIEFHLYGNGSREQVDAALFHEKSLSGLTVRQFIYFQGVRPIMSYAKLWHTLLPSISFGFFSYPPLWIYTNHVYQTTDTTCALFYSLCSKYSSLRIVLFVIHIN